MCVSPLWLARGALAATGLAVATACAPSHRLVHEGDRYFEHCYGADFDLRVAPTQKEACWQAWITYYTKHQPAHRVDYALARIESLQNGEPEPQLPGMIRGARSGGEVSEELARVDAAAGNVSPLLLQPTSLDAGPVLNGCLHFCNEYETRCNERCEPGRLACSATCERERAVCLGGCY